MSTAEIVSVVLGIGLPVVAGIYWAAKQEGRINSNVEAIKDMRQANAEAIADIREDINYIRNRVDAAINGRYR